MLKKVFIYSLAGLMAAVFVLAVTGFAVKLAGKDRVAPGVVLCGREVSGMTSGELEQVIAELVPETVTEMYCRFLPEMKEEIERRVTEVTKKKGDRQKQNGTEGEADEVSLEVWGDELFVVMKEPMFRVCIEETVEAVTEASRRVSAWEWLYKAVTGHALRERRVEAVFQWEEDRLRLCGELLQRMTERDRREAVITWDGEKIKVAESLRGFRLDTEKLYSEAEQVLAEATERMNAEQVEGLVLRFYVKGTALMPQLSTTQAKRCETLIGQFTTFYTGAAGGRVRNIETGAQKLHGTVILPGEEFSVASVLMPFTVANGYAFGGTYIDGQLSESIGGGVCQLSTTLYNALLQTRLDITMRYPHSMSVGYIPLGRDAAIAGDYKDLKFKNTTNVPVLLLCETNGESVKVTLYGPKEAKREEVGFESVIAEQTKESVTVEVYRTEKGEDGKEVRERVSRDRYKERG